MEESTTTIQEYQPKRLKADWVESKLNAIDQRVARNEEKLNKILRLLETKVTKPTAPPTTPKKEKIPARDFKYKQDPDGRIVLIDETPPPSPRDLAAGD